MRQSRNNNASEILQGIRNAPQNVGKGKVEFELFGEELLGDNMDLDPSNTTPEFTFSNRYPHQEYKKENLPPKDNKKEVPTQGNIEAEDNKEEVPTQGNIDAEDKKIVIKTGKEISQGVVSMTGEGKEATPSAAEVLARIGAGNPDAINGGDNTPPQIPMGNTDKSKVLDQLDGDGNVNDKSGPSEIWGNKEHEPSTPSPTSIFQPDDKATTAAPRAGQNAMGGDTQHDDKNKNVPLPPTVLPGIEATALPDISTKILSDIRTTAPEKLSPTEGGDELNYKNFSPGPLHQEITPPREEETKKGPTSNVTANKQTIYEDKELLHNYKELIRPRIRQKIMKIISAASKFEEPTEVDKVPESLNKEVKDKESLIKDSINQIKVERKKAFNDAKEKLQVQEGKINNKTVDVDLDHSVDVDLDHFFAVEIEKLSKKKVTDFLNSDPTLFKQIRREALCSVWQWICKYQRPARISKEQLFQKTQEELKQIVKDIDLIIPKRKKKTPPSKKVNSAHNKNPKLQSPDNKDQDPNSKDHDLDNKGQDLDNEGQDLNNKGQDLDNEGQDLDNKDQDIDNKDQDIDNKDQDIDNEDHDLDNKDQDIDNEGQDLDNKDQNPNSKDHDLDNKRQDLDNEGQDLDNEGQDLDNKGQDLDNEGQDLEGNKKEIGGVNNGLNHGDVLGGGGGVDKNKCLIIKVNKIIIDLVNEKTRGLKNELNKNGLKLEGVILCGGCGNDKVYMKVPIYQ